VINLCFYILYMALDFNAINSHTVLQDLMSERVFRTGNLVFWLRFLLGEGKLRLYIEGGRLV